MIERYDCLDWINWVNNKIDEELPIYLAGISMGVKDKFMSKVNLRKEIWRNRKTHKYFKCKNCKAYLRVPKEKGKIEITCRKCGHKMRKKS